MINLNKIRASFQRERFRFGLEDVRKAFIASSKEFSRPDVSAEKSVRERYGLKPGDPVPDIVYDEEGIPVQDFWEEVGELTDETTSTSKVVRLTFLISLFHFWERHSNRWIGKTAYDHQAVMAWLQGRGITPDANMLKQLELAANCAKHGPGKSCNALFTLQPGFFDQSAVMKAFYPSDENLDIDDATLERFFNAVARSGP